MSAWDRPVLDNPILVTLDEQHRNLAFPQDRDVLLSFPASGRCECTWGLVVWGGRNVVLENGTYYNSTASGAAQFKNQAGVMWAHGVHFAGPQLTEGIDLQQPIASAVVLRNVLIDHCHGSYTSNHADILQSWSGPKRLLIDGLTASCDYQGFFLLPNQWDKNVIPTIWDFRHVNLHLAGAYAFTLGVGPNAASTKDVQLNIDEVYVDGYGEPRVFAGQGFEDVKLGPPPGGDFVVASGNFVVGVDEAGAPAPLPGEE